MLTRFVLVWGGGTSGPDHPLIQAVNGEATEKASIEVLNFPATEGDIRMGELNATRSSSSFSSSSGGGGGGGGGGRSSGNDKRFDELRSAVVFRDWFDTDQQQVCIYIGARCGLRWLPSVYGCCRRAVCGHVIDCRRDGVFIVRMQQQQQQWLTYQVRVLVLRERAFIQGWS